MKMKWSTRSIAVITAITLVAVCSTAALAQDEGRGRRGRGGFGRGGMGAGMMGDPTLMLLANPTVQSELELADEQKEQIRALGEEMRSSMQGLFGGGGDRSDENRRQRFAEMREKMQEQQKKAKEKLGEILLPHQMDRLKQLSIQARGLAALADDEVASELNLSAEQKSKLESIREEADAERSEMFQSARGEGGFEGIREKMEQLRKSQEEKTLAVLTDEQKQKFEEMQGEKVDIQLGPPGGRGGFGRGGFGGGQRRRPASD